jgi:hypothetical protein
MLGCDLIKWHSMMELNFGANETEQTTATYRAIAKSCGKAFVARLGVLAIPTFEALAQASEGDAAL